MHDITITEDAIWLEPYPGTSIHQVATAALDLCAEHGLPVRWDFNGTTCVATTGMTADAIVTAYHAELDAKYTALQATPAYQAAREAAETAQREREATCAQMLAEAPALSLRDAARWGTWVDANQTPYGAACVAYAERWARLMAARMQAGETLEACAEAMSHMADTEGITGFMYGVAVQMLAECWVHGEALRRWHNLHTQFKDEGERANATGSVLNPALLSISKGL